jgi:hypothetical protein
MIGKKKSLTEPLMSTDRAIKRDESMSRSIAKWLVDFTSLTVGQISQATGLHMLAVRAFLNFATLPAQILDPIASGFVTRDEIKLCEKDAERVLKINFSIPKDPVSVLLGLKERKNNFISKVKKRAQQPAVAWLIHNYPELTERNIASLTKATIDSVKKLKDPVRLRHVVPESAIAAGFCTQADIDEFLSEN